MARIYYKTEFFYRPGNDPTNNSLYETLNEMGLTMVKREIVIDGESTIVFDVGKKFIKYVRDGKISIPYDAQVYEKLGDVVRPWHLHEKKIRKKAKIHQRRKFRKMKKEKESQKSFSEEAQNEM